MSRPRAMSLMEVVVYCFLLSIFTGAIFLALPGRITRDTQDLDQAGARGGIALTRLTRELANSSASSIEITEDPPAIVFASAEPSSGSNSSRSFGYSSDELSWRWWVAYVLEDKTLNRYQTSFGGSQLSKPPSPKQVMAGAKPSKVADGVAEFAVKQPEAGVWQFYLRLEESGSFMQLQTAVGPRN